MVWLHWVFVATQAFSSCGMWALSSPSRLSTLVPCIGRQILFIYLFMVELRLRCCVQAFPSCHEHGTTPPYLQDAVFLLQWLLWLQSTGSRVLVLQGLWHVGSGVVALRLTCLQQVESSQTRDGTHVHCTGRFLTTGLPRKVLIKKYSN